MTRWKWEVRSPKGPGEANGMYDVCGTLKKPHLQKFRVDEQGRRLDKQRPTAIPIADDTGFVFDPDEPWGEP